MPDISSPSPNHPPPDASSDIAPSIDSSPATAPRPFPTRPLALALFIACPILILAPPRKIDLYTFSLSTAWVISAQKLYELDSHQLPVWIKRRRPFTAAANEEGADEKLQSIDPGRSKLGDEEEHEKKEQGGVVGMARRLWMGKEQPGWKERRLREEREKLAQGESYAGLIGDTIMEAFGAAKKAEEDSEQDPTGRKSE
ncbi:hypothetical protein MMC07_005966 [Pseudocyphellaria aurata]|nr:hypothetical protein [Pseudocyphellaria aurata]